MFRVRGWIGHNGSLPGYQTLAIHRPGNGTSVVILLNSDVPFEGRAGSTVLGEAVTSVLTPKHVYNLGATPGH